MKDGSNTTEGHTYQDIPGSGLPFHRGDTVYRGKRIGELVELRGKSVLDLGCSVGTLSQTLAEQGALVLGVDYDADAIATAIKHHHLPAFAVRDITLEYIRELPRFDVIVWLSQFMWTAKQHGLEYALDCLWELSKKCDVLVFETAGKDGSAPLGIDQEEVIQLLLKNTLFQNIRDTGPWSGGVHMIMNWPPRNVFICSKPFLGSETGLSKISFPKIGVVQKTYQVGEGSVGRELIGRELAFIEMMKSVYAPTVLGRTEDSILMTYEGPRAAHIPEHDLKAIASLLRSNGIIHRDIRPDNLLWDGRNVVLIDYSYAIQVGEQTNYSHDLGGGFKSPYGFDDEYSLRKIQHALL